MADASFKQEFLNTHNTYRAQHSTPALSLNSNMCQEAQTWANHLLRQNTLMHSNTSDGENIYAFSSSAPVKLTGREAVSTWYNEMKNYSWSRPGYSGNTGHFTQVLWKDSRELGVGMATDGKRAFVVGQYRPAGNMNMPGYFEKNVLPKVTGGRDIPDSSSGTNVEPGAGSGSNKGICCTLL